jgi:hypothetical protein
VAMIEHQSAPDFITDEKVRSRRLGLLVTLSISVAAWAALGLGLRLTSIV